MKKLLCLPLSVYAVVAFAQVDVTGKVVMGESQEPAVYAEVSSVENPSETTMTDEFGNFNITLTANTGNLQVISIEGTSTVIPYEGNQTLTVKLNSNEFTLNEVVAIGYGSVDKADLTTSVASIENIETAQSRSVSNVAEFLQGQTPGVTVTNQGGDPTAMPNINIRGINTINNSQILYVVDGLPYYGTPINPREIRSISVLKDAAAAAIYGSQASNGVIIIETKSGIKGKPQVEINMFTGFQEATDLPTPLTATERNKVYTQAFQNDGLNVPDAYNATKNPWGAVTRTNWMDEIFRKATIHGINANLSGATENINYFTSLEYLDKNGVLKGTNTKRLSARGKVDVNLTEKLKSGVNLLYSEIDGVGANTSNGYSGTIINALYMPSSAPVYDELGNFHGTVPTELSHYAGAYGDVYNPLAQLLRPTTSNPISNFKGQGYLSYEPTKDLILETSFGYNKINNHYKKFTPRIPEIGRSNDENFLNESFELSSDWTWQNTLNYKLKLDKHNFDATLVYSAQQTEGEYHYTKSKNFDIEKPYYHFFSFANDIMERKGDKYKTRMASAIGRLMYDYNKRYYISASLRRDETSQANPEGDYQVGWFPGVSGAWRISKEPFYQSNTITNLKLRASWGKLGNVSSLSPYSFASSMSTGKVIVGEDGAWNDIGVWLSQRPSTKVTWETIRSYDFGLDFSLFRKLNATVDYYNKTTLGMIAKATQEDHHGLSPEYINAGDVENKGFEIGLSYNDTFGDVSFGAGVNVATNENKLVSVTSEFAKKGNDEISVNKNVRDQLFPYKNKVGESLYSYYLIPYQGIFQSQQEIDDYTHKGSLIQPNAKPGDFKFKDVNGDGIIDNNDRVFSGSYSPDITYAFNFNIAYKGFDLSAFFQGVAGVDVFNAYKFTGYSTNLDFNADNRILNAWTPENTNTNIPRLSHSDNNKNFSTNSTWYLEDGSYLRLKNITLGYDFSRFINDFVSKARLYISAENVFTITNYSGIDPEVGGLGLDNAQYPVARTVSVGATFNF